MFICLFVFYVFIYAFIHSFVEEFTVVSVTGYMAPNVGMKNE